MMKIYRTESLFFLDKMPPQFNIDDFERLSKVGEGRMMNLFFFADLYFNIRYLRHCL